MSESTSDRLPTNEEVIDDLTKDLRDIQFSSSPGTVGENGDQKHIPKDFEESDNDDKDPDRVVEKEILSDESDDEELKNQEIDLTEEEKDSKKNEALELKKQGNEEFKNECYLESIKTYSKALRICPLKFSSDRAILYSNRAASKAKIERKSSAIDDCTKAIELNDKFIRAYLRRAKLYEDTDKLDESLEDYKKIMELDPGNKEAMVAVHRLPPIIAERNEKLKTEMLGGL